MQFNKQLPMCIMPSNIHSKRRNSMYSKRLQHFQLLLVSAKQLLHILWFWLLLNNESHLPANLLEPHKLLKPDPILRYLRNKSSKYKWLKILHKMPRWFLIRLNQPSVHSSKQHHPQLRNPTSPRIRLTTILRHMHPRILYKLMGTVHRLQPSNTKRRMFSLQLSLLCDEQHIL